MSAFFVYAGYSSSMFLVRIKHGGIHLPVLPPTKERLVSIPARNGSWDYGAYYGDMPITLDCEIYDPTNGVMTYDDLLAHTTALATILDVRLGKRPLILPNSTLIWNARYAGTSEITMNLGLFEFKLPFLADPFASAA